MSQETVGAPVMNDESPQSQPSAPGLRPRAAGLARLAKFAAVPAISGSANAVVIWLLNWLGAQ
ncbi:hypothetical protein ACFYT3_31765 [Nocardia amikacinitolerans]|uniref:hypothetical protein n=1 Tax=Nocardia amikacinitolerans TaxID=756689 RepID=UPI00368558C5